MKSIKITPNKLRKLYQVRKISSPEIAKIYQCRPEYIRHLLRKFKIRIRTKSEARRLLSNINIPRKELEKLYLKEKLSSPKIAKKFNCSPGFVRNELKKHKIPIRTIQEALPLSNKPKYPQYNFNGNLEEKAYFIGFRIGDLHVYSTSEISPTVFIHTNSTKPDFIQLIEHLFSPYGHIWKSKPDPNNNKAVCIRCSLNKSFNFLLNKKDLIEPWILENTNYFAAFLGGYIDAEGTFCLCGGDAVFSIKSQDKNILQQIRTKLIESEILLRPSQMVRKKGTRDGNGIISNKDVYAVYIHRKDAILKLIDLINSYLKYSQRRKSMKIVKNNIFWRNKKCNRYQRSKWDKLYLEEGVKICQATHIGAA